MKRWISILVSVVMLTAFVPNMANAAMSINIGDYVQMGTYYDEPILWRCVDIDENGPLMLADKILCLKPFDAQTSANSATGSHSSGRNRANGGSNYWADSNIRSWLNSTANTGDVQWLCGNPPSEGYVWSGYNDDDIGYNDYDTEAGFLANFTQSERNAIKEVSQKSILSYPEIYEGMASIGTEKYEYYENITDVTANYDSAYAEYVTDRMFLLDVKQLNAVYNNRGILGDYYYIGQPTAQCVTHSEYTSSSLSTGSRLYYWLRSPRSTSDTLVRYVDSSGNVSMGSAYSGLRGVRPAFYLNLSSISVKSGNGTRSDPYTVDGDSGETVTKPIVTPTPQLEVDNNYSGGNELIKQSGIDANNLLSNISVGTDTIRGPKISILGYDFYLFELDGKCSLSLGNVKIQLKADEKKKSIQILGGYDFLSESVSTGTSYTERGEWTKAYNDLKSLHHALAGGMLDDATARSKFSSVYSKLKKNDSNIFLNIKGNFAVYGELTWDNGSWQMVEGGGILKASASGSIDPRIGGIFYGTFGISVDASGKFAIKYDTSDKNLAVDAKLTIEPAINVGVGAGLKKAKLYIEGGLKGKLPIDIAAVTGSFKTGSTTITPFKVTAKGYLYMSGKVGIFSADKEWQLGDDAVLFPRKGGEITLQSITDEYTIDRSDFTMMSRDYGNNASLMSLSDAFDKCDLYPYSTPKLAQLSDGGKLLLWIDDDSSKADADRTSMYYSIYNPEDDFWTTPQIAVSNIGYNDLPQIYQNGNNVYIVWACVDEALGDSAEMDDMLAKMNLYYTCFAGDSFSEPVLISENNNGLCEVLYTVSESDGAITVVWVENSENDLSLSEGTNYIYKRTLSSKGWSNAQKVAQTTAELHDIELTSSGDVVYELGEDGKAVLYMGENKIGESENDNSAFQICEDTVYYLSDNKLITYDTKSGETAEDEIGEITDITILDNGSSKTALSLLSTGFTNELYQNEYKDGKWGEWTQLTDYNKYIRDYSVISDDNGSLTLALNLVDVKDEEKGGYGEAELKVISDFEYSDIILDNVLYYDGDVNEGETVDVCFNVTNNSRNYINSINAKITDEAGNVMYSGDIDCDIAAGETALLTAPITIPSSFKKQTLTVSVTGDFEENNTENNSAQLTIGFADIEPEQVELTKSGDKVMLEGYIKNIGFEKADNVTLKIYNSDSTDELLQTVSLNSIASGASEKFEFELPQKYLTADEEKYAIYIEAATDSEEIEIGNNSDRIVFADLSEVENINDISMEYDNGTLTIKSPESLDADFIAAYYNINGRLIACRKLNLSIAIGTNDIPIEGLTTGSNVIFMLWNSDMKPLCNALTWE